MRIDKRIVGGFVVTRMQPPRDAGNDDDDGGDRSTDLEVPAAEKRRRCAAVGLVFRPVVVVLDFVVSTAAFVAGRRFVMNVVTNECAPPFVGGHGDFRRTVRWENVSNVGLLPLPRPE
ncbi:MAG: hypothetical protein JSS04_20185 [Proteobacteria bacterium]|nr:hypothetical protein [Pseudomonadota bacterium]